METRCSGSDVSPSSPGGLVVESQKRQSADRIGWVVCCEERWEVERPSEGATSEVAPDDLGHSPW